MPSHFLGDREFVSSLSNGCAVIRRVRILRVEHGMRCWIVGDGLRERSAVGTSDVGGQNRDLLGFVVCQRNDEVVWSGSNQTHGYATFWIARELEKRLVRAQRD